MSPIKLMLLQKQQSAFRQAQSPAQKLAVVAEISAILGADADKMTSDNASKGFPCAALRALSAVRITLC